MKVSLSLVCTVFVVVLVVPTCTGTSATYATDTTNSDASETETEEKKEEIVGDSKTRISLTLQEEAFPDFSEESSHLVPTPEEKRCSVHRFVNGKFQGAQYDLLKILKKYGGPPGKVNATWSKKEDPPIKKEDLAKRPLPDADQKYWLYKYGDTDAKTYVRIEHAVQRFSGTSKSFLEVRGTLYFTPEDFCGKSRRAFYTVDDRGFTFQVTDEYCKIGSTVRCASLASCKTDEYGRIGSCSAPSNALLASLVGGGKNRPAKSRNQHALARPINPDQQLMILIKGKLTASCLRSTFINPFARISVQR